MIRPNAHIAAMRAYALADLSAPAGKHLIPLCQNESLRPASPMAIEASCGAAQGQHLYPDPDWTELRAAISAVHGIGADSILCGNGSLDLIGCIARAYLGAGDAALAPEHAYPFFRTATVTAGARFDTAAERDLTTDVDTLLAAVTPETRIVFVANPGNPTGTRIARSGLVRLREELPENVLLVIDEAYGEFADHLDASLFDLTERGDTIVLRSFSKAYGLAGARVGWGVFPHHIGVEIRKLLNPNNVSTSSQLAAAAAVRDQAYMRETCRQTAEIRDRFIYELEGRGFDLPTSFTNFVLIRFPSAAAAQSADRYLRTEGVFLRAQGGAGLPQCLRLTIGAKRDMALTTELLTRWRQEEGQP